MSEILGQITPDTEFGKLLTFLATESRIILEIGTWKGMGSTQCLYLGMSEPSHSMITLESNKAMWEEAIKHYDDPRLKLIHGTIIDCNWFPEFHHSDPNFYQYWEADKKAVCEAPHVLNLIPEKVDLLLLDGGDWTSELEMAMLYPRCRTIALDDTNPHQSIKNYRNRKRLLELGWTVIADNPHERHGYFVARRP